MSMWDAKRGCEFMDSVPRHLNRVATALEALVKQDAERNELMKEQNKLLAAQRNELRQQREIMLNCMSRMFGGFMQVDTNPLVEIRRNGENGMVLFSDLAVDDQILTRIESGNPIPDKDPLVVKEITDNGFVGDDLCEYYPNDFQRDD